MKGHVSLSLDCLPTKNAYLDTASANSKGIQPAQISSCTYAFLKVKKTFMPMKMRRQTKITVDHKVPTNPDPTFATTPNIVNARRSPNEAAKGVARLSAKGFQTTE